MQDLKPICITAEPLVLNQFFDSLRLFSLLAHKPWAIWLDSGESSHIDARYDIMVWDPVLTLETSENITHVFDTLKQSSQAFNEQPLALVKKIQSTLFKNIILPKAELPFKGGAVGYFSYDLGRTIETLPSIAKNDIAIPDMAIGIYTQAIIFDRNKNSYILLCPEDKRQDLTDYLQKLLSQTGNKKPKNAINSITDSTAKFSLTSPWQANMTKNSYQEKFTKVQDYLLTGDAYQVNLAQRFSATYQGDEFTAYLKLRQANQSPFSAFMRLNENSILSLSPERFLQLQQNKVQSKPIKGTRKRSGDPIIDKSLAQDLLTADKDRAENLMIVDLLRNDISKTCIAGSVKVPKLFHLESFAAVHHLVSTVEGELSPEYTATDLLSGAFPGGSITGAPKIRAMEIIEELEPHRRSIYCGSIGYISACGNMDTSITIRTLVCENNNIHCWAGGGLVADSDVESEYQETLDKVNKILPVLANDFPND